ncbi:MAG: M23 family metallopeptidase [Sphingobacteriales bacterium]
MLKTITLICMLSVFTSIKSNTVKPDKDKEVTVAEAASISISPTNPLIEKDQYGQYLNFDILVKNTGTHTLYLATIEASVMDASVKPVFRQSINVNGQAAGIKSVGNTLLRPGETISIFNPFFTYAPDVKITFLQYQFFFDYADSPQQRENNKKRLPVDFDVSIKKIITPRAYTPKTAFNLPLKGKVTVVDGHNLSSGAASMIGRADKGIILKSDRYAFDFASVDENGNMYKTDPFKKENWFVFGKPVYAPAGGIVVDMQNSIPDNEFSGKVVKSPRIAPDADPDHLGNYIIIDHGNGDFSMLQHLEQGSIMVRTGQLIQGGQQIAKIGFSGNITFPHLHYRVMNGQKALSSWGVPSYFDNYKLYKGSTFILVKKGRVDGGDIVESAQ